MLGNKFVRADITVADINPVLIAKSLTRFIKIPLITNFNYSSVLSAHR